MITLSFGCGKKEHFAGPDIILKKWSDAVKRMSYPVYSQCEAYPKSQAVFFEMYRDYYFQDVLVTDIEDDSPDRIKKDIHGDRFIYRNVKFECAEIARKTSRALCIVRGDVDFVRFIDGKRKNDGWLMANRTLIRIKR